MSNFASFVLFVRRHLAEMVNDIDTVVKAATAIAARAPFENNTKDGQTSGGASFGRGRGGNCDL
jgi:hypothetical protein